MISGVTTDDLTTAGNYTTLQCASTHLTSFAVLVDVARGLEVIPHHIALVYSIQVSNTLHRTLKKLREMH